MKTAAFALGMLAAVANAAAYPRIHARYDNSTAIPEPSASTTLTVIQTNTQTITSCKPTITNCPANQSDIDKLPESDKEPVVVTNTVVLTTTVCPIEDVPKVSSSVVEDANNGLITGSTVTLSTTYIQPDVPEKTATPEKPVEGGDNSAEHGEETPKEEKPKEEKPKTEAPKEEQTTTTTATSTSTRYITIAPKPKETGSENSPETGSDNGTGKGDGDVKDNGNGKGEECVPETVTVTAPASTVYVTVGGADKTQDATTKPTDMTDGDNSAEHGEEIPEDCIPEDEDEDEDETDEDEGTEDEPKEETPKDETPAKDGENSPVDGADGSGCDLETSISAQPTETAVPTSVYPPAPEEPTETPAETPVETPVETSVETPAATAVIPGGEGDFITTSIMPSAAKPTGAKPTEDAKPTGFYRVRR